MKQLNAHLLATPLSPTEFGARIARGDHGSAASRWSWSIGRPLVAKAVLRWSASHAVSAVSQPWHACENSAPDSTLSQNPSQRISEVALLSWQPDRCLTGERAAEGWATRLDISQAAAASGDAQSSPQVRVHERGQASRMRDAGKPNLLP